METDDFGSTRVVDYVSTPPTPERAEELAHYLVVVEGVERGRRIALGATQVTIGRVEPCDVVLPDTQISRAHCRVEVVSDDALVTDLGSTNGTHIDGERITGAARIANGGVLRLGSHMLRYELRSRREVAASEEMERDMGAARSYIESMLPTRIATGPVRTDWLFEPSARIGGDALYYQALDDQHFAMYLMDVAGHGAGAALHAASIMNVMRKQALPGVDMRQPGEVLRGLNAMFPMQDHGNLFFSAWYGVYRHSKRELRYCCGGHHAGYLYGPGRSGETPLWNQNPMVGVLPEHDYLVASTPVVPDSTLYLFSDGLFEIETATGIERGLDDFLPLLRAPAASPYPEPERLVREVRRATGRSVFEDDLTLLVAVVP